MVGGEGHQRRPDLAEGRQVVAHRPGLVAPDEGADHADGQYFVEITFLELAERRAHAPKRVGQHRQQRMPLVGQRQTAREALEQCDAENVFKRLDLMADGRLRDPKLHAGPRKAAMPRRGFEDAQGVQR